MDVFIYFHSRLNVSLDELEDRLDEHLRPAGEVTGTGSGLHGSNIDIHVNEPGADADRWLDRIRRVLLEYDLPKDTVLSINGIRRGLHDDIPRNNY